MLGATGLAVDSWIPQRSENESQPAHERFIRTRLGGFPSNRDDGRRGACWAPTQVRVHSLKLDVGSDSAITLRRSADAPEQFADFYRDHLDAILAFLMRRVGDAELALDLAAESFAQAYVARRRFRGSTPQQAQEWVYQIARRQLSRYLRRGRLERRAILKLGIEVPNLDDEQQARIQQMADLDGLRATLRSELARLSPAQQAALQLRIVNELPYAAVAQHLETTEQAARLRGSRGLAAPAAALEDNPRLRGRTA